MRHSSNIASPGSASPIEDAPRALTLEEAGQVSGGCPLLLIGLAIACAVLLEHD